MKYIIFWLICGYINLVITHDTISVKKDGKEMYNAYLKMVPFIFLAGPIFLAFFVLWLYVNILNSSKTNYSLGSI